MHGIGLSYALRHYYARKKSAPVKSAAAGMTKATPWPAPKLPAVDPDALLAFAFALLGDSPELAYRPFVDWHETVQRTVFPFFTTAQPCTLPTNTLLRVARHLKFYYDQLALDQQSYDNFNLSWEMEPSESADYT